MEDPTIFDTVVFGGSAVKAMGAEGNVGKIGGYLVQYTGPHEPDEAAEFFDAGTDFLMEDGLKTPVYYHHGLNRTVGRKSLGHGVLTRDGQGVRIYAELDLSDSDARRAYEDTERGVLGWSSGTANHLVDREAIKTQHGTVYRIKRWPLGLDASLTRTPANPKLRAVALKSVLDETNPDLIDGATVDGDALKADWSTAFKDTLPDASFAYIEPGGHKDSEGKTVPRSLRHFPYKDADGKPDAAHVRNALARIPQSDVSAEAKDEATKKVRAAAKALGIGEAAGAAGADKKGKNADAKKSVDPDTLPDMLEALASGHVGLKLRDHSQAVLDAAKGLVRRVEDKAEKRAFSPAALKSGRVMSGENYAFHDATCSALESIVAQYRTHLDKHKPEAQMDGKTVAGVMTHPTYPAAVAYGGAGKSADFDAATFDAELEDLEIAVMQQALRQAALRQAPLQVPIEQASARTGAPAFN